jgi:hypothetical protein
MIGPSTPRGCLDGLCDRLRVRVEHDTGCQERDDARKGRELVDLLMMMVAWG